MRDLKFNLISLMFRLKPALKNEIGKDSSRRVLGKMKNHYKEIDKREPKKKGIMTYHRQLWIIGLSLYRAMQEESYNNNDSIETIHQVLWNTGLRQQSSAIAFFVRRSKNPFNRYLQFLGPRNDRFFPCPPWEKVEVELENGIGWDQKKCPVYEYFKKEGVVELTRAYCDIDKLVAALVPNHIELKRDRTLAKGDNSCDFYYYKK
jgi:hypothetical protein